jgi:pimeloyl-ACP methyl ester carboxylesterase
VDDERRVRGNGLSLFVTEWGERGRPTVVLLHGFPDTSAVWAPVAQRLSADFHVVAYDVRGAGRSDLPRTRRDYALPLLVDDLVAVLDATCPDAAVHLVAHDWGSIQGWEAVTTKGLADRFASYTSISGPPLDHAALWARRHRTLRPADLRLTLRQTLHSWYIAYFHLPFLPELMAHNQRATALWASRLHRVERVPTDEEWPAPTFGADFAHGVNLYRANMLPRMRHAEVRHADVPVQLIVPTRDRYIMPELLDGVEEWTSRLWRRPADAGHWLIRTDPSLVAGWVRELVTFIATGEESDGLTRSRVAPTTS